MAEIISLAHARSKRDWQKMCDGAIQAINDIASGEDNNNDLFSYKEKEMLFAGLDMLAEQGIILEDQMDSLKRKVKLL